MSAVTDVLEIAKDVAPVLLEIAEYVRGDKRDQAEEDRLGRALIRRAFDARAEREIGSP